MKENRRSPLPAASGTSAANSSAVAAAAPSPPLASPNAKGTAKYTNKDGSKFITVSKSVSAEALPLSSPPPPLQPSSPSPVTGPAASTVLNTMSVPNGPAQVGNRKKAKRRAKAAAAREKAGLEDITNGHANGILSSAVPKSKAVAESHVSPPGDEAGDSEGDNAVTAGGPQATSRGSPANASKPKKPKKKKKKKDSTAADSVGAVVGVSAAPARPGQDRPRHEVSKEKIWNTNSQEERQRIKEFWLDLTEEERKSLVKVEKDTVLKKMKEQQKMTCSCHFCGRKRTAIEEELEGLYDSYYEELEQFANDPAGQQNGRTPALMSSTGRFGPSHTLHSPTPTSTYAGHQPSRGQIVEHAGEDGVEEGDEEYCDDDDDDDDLVAADDDSEGEEEDIPPEELHRDYASDFFTFGNSLQVHGGILTVADDLLKNDGRKFIEMMEQLAERRMAREEDAKDQYANRGAGFAPNMNGIAYGHNHQHIPEEEDDYGPEDEDDEDYDSQDEEYDDEEDAMTEEQRMEEGRKMFQIFAARMFEQRVLTAYREKVAKERQEKLLEELADEATQENQRREKKAKEAQKRKDKAAQKKQALAEEKARKEAEKATEDAERRAQEAQKAEEQRQIAEERRKKREAVRKAEEDDRLRKEAERLRRIHEQKERQAEQERKAREAKEREKKRKEEARLKEKEAHEKRERDSRERKEKQERDKREKEARARANEARERQKQEERAAQRAAFVPAIPTTATPASAATQGSASSAVANPSAITLPKRPSQQERQRQQQPQQQQQQPTGTIPALPQQPQIAGTAASPRVTGVLPALSKAPTPMRNRQPSQHDGSTGGSQGNSTSRTASLSGSGQSQNASPNPTTPVQASVGSFGAAKAQTNMGLFNQGTAGFNQSQQPFHQAVSPLSASAKSNMAPLQTSPFSMASSPVGLPYPPGIVPVTLPPGLNLSSQYASNSGGAFRPPGPLPMMPMPPGINSLPRGFGPMAPPPGFGHLLPPDQLRAAAPGGPLATDNGGVPALHARHPSDGFDAEASSVPSAQPIGRPGPIGRPASTVPGQPHVPSEAPAGMPMGNSDAENPYNLGSKALLDDSDFAPDEFSARRPTAPTRPPFGAPLPGSFGVDLTSPFLSQSSLWGGLPPHAMTNSFANGPPPGFPVGNGAPGAWGGPVNPTAFAPHGSLGRSSQGRSVTLRQLLCRACKELASGSAGHEFVAIDAVKSRINMLAPHYLPGPVHDAELNVLYDTEGNGNNGGGDFDVRRNSDGSVAAIRWTPDSLVQRFMGEAASPAVGYSETNTAPIGATPLREG